MLMIRVQWHLSGGGTELTLLAVEPQICNGRFGKTMAEAPRGW